MRRKVKRNNDPSKLTRSSSSSSSSGSSADDDIDPSLIGFNPGVEVTETGLSGVDRLPRLKNWNAFQELLEAARKKKAD
jgi:hypothetical protein